ncbi:replicative DNA helicase [Phenylobacterium montanum]|uniref:Replicative DNA helicase n=1 Tax=Phenylobacterium montanum TaxID=2823693 RepID=A0A975ITP8_9CAUL|nr:replicative DNA helicase [Caulobacter sp. S6]QUD86955.1 replicative DNA helicase [Caulobacter sp. S6]
MTIAPALRLVDEELPAAAPHNLDAEQALLGVLLFDNAQLDELPDLDAAAFYEPTHGRIFASAQYLIASGLRADPISVSERLKADSGLAELGGQGYLVDLVDHAPPALTARQNAGIVADNAQRRELIRIGEEMAEAARTDQERSGREHVEAAEQALFELTKGASSRGGFQGVGVFVDRALELADEAFGRDGGLAGIATGLIDLDQVLGGLHRSDLIILAARPSMGKTALAMNIARHAAAGGVPTGVFSCEMSGEQLVTRLLAEISAISSDRVRRGDIDLCERGRLRDAGAEMRSLPLHIDASGGLSLTQLVTRARRLKRRHGLGLIVVDYLQLMSAGGGRRENRVQEVSEITMGLKALAKDLDVPILALSQLSRQVEAREDKRPQLSDLRDSGSIEQDADVVMFLYREAYYLARREPREGTSEHLDWEARLDEVAHLAELIIAKQRHGPIRTVKLHYSDELTKFSNLARAALHSTRAFDFSGGE